MILSPGSRLGAYEVLASIGAGGMGEVYRARDTRLGREVALKVLPEALATDRDRLTRFEQEARAASSLNHPHIVTVYEIGREAEVAFIAMELVDGKTLRELTASGALPVRRMLGVAAQVAEGLAKAHAAGIVHRDLKPENVMVSKDGFVKILDFGLAKLIEAESGELSAMPTLASPQTRPGTVLGTVSYMSPEQASGEPLDYRSDQFSLGSILYEMATGQKPFQRKTAAETMSAIIREEPEALSKQRPDLPPPVRWILERLLAKDREERYTSTRDLARDLSSVRDHISEVSGGAEAVSAGPARARRTRIPLIGGVALLTVGVLAGWAATHGFSKPGPSAPSFHRLTFHRGVIGNARFAPDGQTILYGATVEGESAGMHLYLTRQESPESRRFEFPDTDIASISSSGELAIILDFKGNSGTLARLPMAGGTPRPVLENVNYASADWAPDGNELVVSHSVEGKDRLEFPIGKVLVEGDAVGSPRFSPSGETIAFWDFNKGTLNEIGRDGTGRRALSSGWASPTGVPCWRSDGREIWFTAAEGGEPEALWAVDLSGKRRLVTRVPGQLELDDISRDGRVLIAHHTQESSLMGLAPGESKERELSWLDMSHPAALSDDGKTLVITEQGEASRGAPSVYLRGTDGSPAVRLGEGRGLALSSDGKWVLASLDSSGQKPPSLLLLPTGPGQTRVLKNGGLADYGWGAFLPDGKRIIFGAHPSGGKSRLYMQEIPEGDPRPFGPEGAAIWEWSSPVSPDGRFVVARLGARAVLCPLEGAAVRPIPGVDVASEDRPSQWTSDGRSLYVSRIGEPRVWLVDVATGQRRLWKEIQPTAGRFFRMRVTPDGRSYVYTTQRFLSELYVVEGLR